VEEAVAAQASPWAAQSGAHGLLRVGRTSSKDRDARAGTASVSHASIPGGSAEVQNDPQCLIWPGIDVRRAGWGYSPAIPVLLSVWRWWKRVAHSGWVIIAPSCRRAGQRRGKICRSSQGRTAFIREMGNHPFCLPSGAAGSLPACLLYICNISTFHPLWLAAKLIHQGPHWQCGGLRNSISRIFVRAPTPGYARQ
jgi:hypothetical protein